MNMTEEAIINRCSNNKQNEQYIAPLNKQIKKIDFSDSFRNRQLGFYSAYLIQIQDKRVKEVKLYLTV